MMFNEASNRIADQIVDISKTKVGVGRLEETDYRKKESVNSHLNSLRLNLGI